MVPASNAGPSSHRALPGRITISLSALPPQTPIESANLMGHAPVLKVAGSRCDIKGKARATDSRKRKLGDADSAEAQKSTKKGRAAGSQNYQELEVRMLLQFTDRVLPIGGTGWASVGALHREWSRTVKHLNLVPRSDTSLETKYKQVCSG